MIHALRKLAREIHRRSVWQVLTVYALVSWVILRAVDLLTRSTGLPEWTPEMAFVLLLLGLPIVIATAVVQEGIPGLRIEDFVDPNELEGLTPDQVLVVPEAHPLHGTTLFTWRNAVLGGVMAAALLMGSVTAYLAMWSFGIGPVGSLLAQGVLDVRDRVVLADFENLTDDTGLGTLVTQAFRVDVERSGIVEVSPEELIAETLRVIGSGPEAPRTEQIAREVAARLGAKVLITGDVSRQRSSFVIRAAVRRTETGEALATFTEMAGDESELLGAIDMLAQRIRERIGESLRAIRADAPLASATTSSLPAFGSYAEAVRAEVAGDYGRALNLLEEALDTDAGFALAEEKLEQIRARIAAGAGSDGW